MPWTPTNVVADVSPIVTNLLQFIRDNQVAALKWANGNQDGLAKFEVIYNSDEGSYQSEIFPNLQAVRERHRSRYLENDVLVEYSIDLLFEVKGSDAAELKNVIKKYSKAVESMLLNVPPDVLMNGLEVERTPVITELTNEEGVLTGEIGNWVVGTFIRFSFEFLV